MENENVENLDSPNEETPSTDTETETVTENVDVAALQKENKELSDNNRQLFERTKKAEGFTKDAEGEWVKAEKPEATKEPEAKPESQPDGPNYAEIAFLEGRDLKHPDDQKIVQDEAERLKLSLTDVLEMEHIKSKLEAVKNTREAEAGMPKGGKKAGGQTPQDVDYWIAKGETPEDATQEFEKVIDARMKKEVDDSKFSDVMYSG